MYLWDLEWVDADGRRLEQWRRPTPDTLEQQAQRWLAEKPRSHVYLYRRRGEISVLMQIFSVETADSPRRQ